VRTVPNGAGRPRAPLVPEAGFPRGVAHGLPGWRNLHFCPNGKSSRTHKTDGMSRLAIEHEVVVSIGDHDEDEQASRAVGVRFVRVGQDEVEAVERAWEGITALLGGG
jgi:hypothetical protein